MTERVDINRLLHDMRAIKSQVRAFDNQALDRPQGSDFNAQKVHGAGFGDLFSQALNKVNSIQQDSAATAKAYITGDPNVDVTDVMIASQKSSVAFQAASQVRNKVVEAYKDIMNMPI